MRRWRRRKLRKGQREGGEREREGIKDLSRESVGGE